jgi:hypothetical protein
MHHLGVSFVFRIRNKPRMEMVQEIPRTEADRAVGVTWQGRVLLGEKWQGEPIRLVKVEVDGKELLLATDLEIEADLIALIYSYRWQIELFFKWMKSILGNRHLMAESPEGVAIQTYSELIAALMFQLLTGKRPGTRAMEVIRFYMMSHEESEEIFTSARFEKISQVRFNRELPARHYLRRACPDVTLALWATAARRSIASATMEISELFMAPPHSHPPSYRTVLGMPLISLRSLATSAPSR